MSGCTKFQVLNATIPPWGYEKTFDIAYGPLDRQKLDVYRPSGVERGAGVVVFFYGGDWQEGDRAEYRFVAQALASRGFVAIIPDYRLYPAVRFPAFVEDGAKAVRWAHDHAEKFGGDRGKLFLMGHSAGAHIAAMLTLDARYLRAVELDRDDIRATAALSGPYDFIPPDYDRGVFDLHPGETKPRPEAQPISFVDGNAPPMLLVHGADDQTVESGNAVRLANKIEETGGRVRTKFYSRKDHVAVLLGLAWPFRWMAPTLDDVTNYFKEMSESSEMSAPKTPKGS